MKPAALAPLFALSAVAALTLSACGGGDDDPDTDPGPQPVASTLKGQVTRAGPLKNVVVCLDLNASNACDADEPTAAATGADGAYTLTYDPAKVTPAVLAAASLIAQVKAGDPAAPTTAVDGDFPTVAATTANYVMTRPAGTGGPINPLTTLVKAGIAAGMIEAAARDNVALQLGIAAAKIDNYQDDPALDTNKVQDTARVAAAMTSAAMRDGAILSVVDQKAAVAAAPAELTRLTYTDAKNYSFQQNMTLAKAAGTVGTQTARILTYVADGKEVPNAYNSAYLTPNGWRVCNDTLPAVGSSGNPSRSTFCGAELSVSYRMPAVALADRAMADVVSDMAKGRGNTVTGALAGPLGNAKFPAASESTLRINLLVNTPVYINALNTDGRPQSEATTLEQLIAAKQASAVNLATSGGSLSLGELDTAARNLRVAFTSTATGPTGPVQFYGCDYNAAQTQSSNCTAIATGTYAITTEGGARVMRFVGQPVTYPAFARFYAEVDWGGANGKWVYTVRQTKPTQAARLSSANRLNATAWQAMRGQLGI